MDKTDEILKILHSLSGSNSPFELFNDWVTCMALSIANTCTVIHDKVWKEREESYVAIMNKYNEKTTSAFAEMMAFLVEALEEITDVLGAVYMKGEMGNKATGQFFTPFNISELTADLGVRDFPKEEIITLNEPSCGGGGMIIATAKRLHDMGVDYQKRMRVVAQDLDWRSVCMCYVQLSFLGIDAIVVQGDTLSDPFREGYDRTRVFRTPRNMGSLTIW